MSSSRPTTASLSPIPLSAAVRLRALEKRYGDVRACSSIDLDLIAGQIHGVLGENGAGKSTLMKMLIGLVQPDAGSIEVHGQRVRIDDPARASELGIGMVHQHFSLVDELRVWENVVLGDTGPLSAAAARGLVASIGDRYGLVVDPDARVGDLTVGLRQRVEIIKCLRRDPDIVIFDEPTSVLTPQESEQLFAVLRLAVTRENKTVALVSHKLEEIQRATDVVTILRRGEVVDSGPTAGFDQRALAHAMVGRPVSIRSEAAAMGMMTSRIATPEPGDDAPSDVGRIVLRVSGATLAAGHGTHRLRRLDLEVRAGEIVGVAGVEGNGQAELCDVLSSLTELDDGCVLIDGVEVPTGVPGAVAAAGLAMIPEDRHDAGCVLDMTVAENLALNEIGTGRSLRRVDRAAMRARAERLIDEFGISCAGPDAPFRSLSGGNQQRVILARELQAGPAVIVASQPTRGLDVGAAEFMGERLAEAARRGVGVLLISSELDELLYLADRVLVIFDGQIVGDIARSEAEPARIGLLMGGTLDPDRAVS